MILYLCSNQNINLFDFLDKEKGLPIKKMSGNFKLKQFVIHDVRNLKQFSFFIIDLIALKDNEDEVIEAIIAFKAMYDARVIVFAEGLDERNGILSKLIDNKVYNIVTSTEYEDIKEEMLECISENGKSLQSAIKGHVSQVDKDGYFFSCKDIRIGVVGAVHKAGTTTTGMNLVNFLADAGAEVAYVEANTNGHLRYLPDFYNNMAVNEAFIGYRGVKYYFNGNFPGENNFTVIDFGALHECRIQALRQCEIIILCGEAKPYEIGFVKAAINKLDGLKLNVVLGFVPRCDQTQVGTIIGGEDRNIYFSEYSPDLFDGSVNETIFSEVVREFMKVGEKE